MIKVSVVIIAAFWVFSLSSNAANDDLPYHEQIVVSLKENNAVIPEVLSVHPTTSMYNREAIIPPQCYTKTEGEHNPCYVCHQNNLPGRENTMNDGDIQLAYSFSEVGLTNHWKNLLN